MKLVRLRVVQEDHTDHTNVFRRSFTGFGLTRHQKLIFWTLEVPMGSNLKLSYFHNGSHSLPFCPRVHRTFFFCYLFQWDFPFNMCYLEIEKHLKNRRQRLNFNVLPSIYCNLIPINFARGCTTHVLRQDSDIILAYSGPFARHSFWPLPVAQAYYSLALSRLTPTTSTTMPLGIVGASNGSQRQGRKRAP